MNTIGLIYFYVCALLAVVGALSTVIAKNPIRGAMGLLLMIVAIAGLFLALHAEFLAFIQLIVYAGAIVVLFLFVIMLLGPSATATHDHKGKLIRTVGGGVFAITAFTAMLFVVHATPTKVFMAEPTADFGSIGSLGHQLFTDGIVPFELASALLLVAVLGALAIAKGQHVKKAAPSALPKPLAATTAHVGDPAE